jgi:hypothetical protein
MLDELIEKHFTKLEEIKKLEESLKETKEIIKGTKKIISEADASLARLMRESKHESFLFQKDGKNLIVYSNGDDCVSFEEIPTLNDLKKELAVGRMLKGSKEIVEQGNINGLPIKKKRIPKQINQYAWTKALNSQIGTIKQIVDILEKR